MELSRPSSVVSIAGEHRGRVLRARDQLITAHIPLVERIARSVHRRSPVAFQLDDLIGEGLLALTRAAKLYRPRRFGGAPFSAYARKKIRGAIVESMRRRNYTEQTRPSIDAGFDQHADPDAFAAIDLDQKRQMERLRFAVTQLTTEQRHMLGAWYLDTEAPRKRARWRRIPRVVAIHTQAISILESEMRRAA